MDDLDEKLRAAERLAAITQKVGYALWRLQELEGVSATCFVLMAQATKGMGLAAGNALEETERKRTFGTTIHRMADAGVIDKKLEARFRALLTERNWLVHRSHADSRKAVYHDLEMYQLLERLERIADEGLRLLKEIGVLAETHANKHGVSESYIQEQAARLLEEWHADE
jgi:uncharacterized protein YutE (UPF0331/DUF86 family)